MKTSRFAVATVGVCGLALMSAGSCKSNDRTHVRTYDYDDTHAQRPREQPVETEREIESGEWHMVSPGEMVVDPKR